MNVSTKKILIGTRGSRLAVAQAQEIKNLIIQRHPQYKSSSDLISIIPIKTTGDKVIDRSLIDIGGKGLFIKEIEEELINKNIDIAVHSMKDMPGFSSEELDIFAVPQRGDARDAFISKKYSSIKELPLNAVVGTSSPRRASLILNQRPDLKIVNFRGNVDTRLEKLNSGKADATILAVAGLERIDMKDKITSIIDTYEMLPAVGQGALALQARKNDESVINILKSLNHSNSETCVLAERAFLKTINGSCNTPLAAYAQIKNDQIHLECLLASLDGQEVFKTSRVGNLNDAIKIGNDAGEEIKSKGKHILINFK